MEGKGITRYSWAVLNREIIDKYSVGDVNELSLATTYPTTHTTT